MRRWLLAAGWAGLAGLLPGSAAANGRYPLAGQLVAQPGDPTQPPTQPPAHLVARTTFGLLRSDDAGASWTWVCEDALGMLDTAEDPALAMTGDGSTVIAYSRGLGVSHDGCSWSPAAGIAAGRFAVDVTVSPTRPHAVLAIELSIDAGAYSLHLVASADDGTTWAEIGDPIPDFLGETVEVAARNPDRIYISGKALAAQEQRLARSDDGGLTFTQVAIAGVSVGAGAYIGAVDPIDPDVVYLRISPTASAPARVLASRDGGASFAELLSLPGDVTGLALSPDGATLAVGGIDSGLYVGSSAGGTFALAGGIKPSCLTWIGTRLFACAKEAVDSFSIGASDDGGAHFTPLLHLADVAPMPCPGTSSAGICASKWSPIAASIGADAGTAPGDAGAPPAAPRAGCACRLAPSSSGAPSSAGAGAFAAVCAAGLLGRRRRHRRG
jgi:hypothetical protein